ncbi:uncharacterized protein [Temnothorax longispinosus]|uniref:uncharacterized protein n=1 Tax=Temnothorax longispinosus TaxID=300112 RepID=UPI003A99FFD1
MKGIYVIAIASLASWAVNAADIEPAPSDPKEDTYANIPKICPYPERNEHNTTTNLPHETDCTLYYKCSVGQPVLQRCPLMTEGDPISRLHYNRLLQVCDWPWQAGCASCPQRYRNGTLPNWSKISGPGTNNCYQYYDCINGVGHLRTCYSGCFSRTCQECVPNRDGGRCPGGPVPTQTPPTTPSTPTPPPRQCTNGARRAHECDCGKYYTCYTPDWYSTDCSGGLHFSPRTNTCLPPNEAGCLLPRNK